MGSSGSWGHRAEGVGDSKERVVTRQCSSLSKLTWLFRLCGIVHRRGDGGRRRRKGEGLSLLSHGAGGGWCEQVRGCLPASCHLYTLPPLQSAPHGQGGWNHLLGQEEANLGLGLGLSSTQATPSSPPSSMTLGELDLLTWGCCWFWCYWFCCWNWQHLHGRRAPLFLHNHC